MAEGVYAIGCPRPRAVEGAVEVNEIDQKSPSLLTPFCITLTQSAPMHDYLVGRESGRQCIQKNNNWLVL